ncbi:MAG: hypothetical protein P1V35_03435, partial [Planctomycetota bacterium]|nr:hypothetical protein [Planctomycetota bacterium]
RAWVGYTARMPPARSWFRLLFLVCATSLVGACHSGSVNRGGGLLGVAENPIPPTDLVEWNGAGFDGAKSDALVSGRPVLLFELLGYVGQEEPGTRASLARSELFSNPEVARAMNAGFECAWRSVGPVARLRLDFAVSPCSAFWAAK